MPESSSPLSPPRNHVFTASSFTVVRLEDLNEIANLKADLVAFYQPANSQELFAVERMAIAQQQILRGARLESGLFTAALDEVLDRTGDPIRPMCEDLAGDGDLEITRAQNRNFATGEGFRRTASESNVWSLLLRFQAQAERQYRRATEELDRLKKLRPPAPQQPAPYQREAAHQPDAPRPSEESEIAPASELAPVQNANAEPAQDNGAQPTSELNMEEKTAPPRRSRARQSVDRLEQLPAANSAPPPESKQRSRPNVSSDPGPQPRAASCVSGVRSSKLSGSL